MQNERETARGYNIFSQLRGKILSEYEKRRSTPMLFLIDAAVFLAGLLFARSSFFFGSHPLAAAYLAVLPRGVWIALIGAVFGSLTLGTPGVIYAMICMIIVFLRVITSGGSRGGGIFSERLLLRMSVATIGGFIAAVYEILLVGFSARAILFGIAMILTPPILTAAYYGLFDSKFTAGDVIGEGKPLFPTEASENEKYKLWYFRVSALVFIFFVSFSMRSISFIGISPSYLFAAAAALLSAKRFGAIPGAAVGFFASLGATAEYAASFMLGGLCAGLLFKLGTVYALVASTLTVGVLSAYIGGVLGIATALPEYSISAALLYPIFAKLRREHIDSGVISVEKSAIDMVGTMALAYKNSKRSASSTVPVMLSSLAAVLDAFLEYTPDKEVVKDAVKSVIKRYTNEVNDEKMNEIATKVCKNERIIKNDLTEFELSDEEIYDVLSELRVLSEPPVRMAQTGEVLRLISTLITEAQLIEESELSMNEPLTDKLEDALSETPLCEGVIRAFGKRQKHIILAGRDDDGTLITSDELKKRIASAADVRLGEGQYFKRGSMALFECGAVKKYTVSSSTAFLPASEREVSGDVAGSFTTRRGAFYSVICDGMGTGSVARRSAELSFGLLEALLQLSAPRDAVMHVINKCLSTGAEECSSSVDIFELDLYSLEATFLKSGAAASYIRRGKSIFRIRSQTAPLGLMSSIDTEKIRVGVEVGDYIIMMSDGVAEGPDDAPWLLELLSAREPRSPREYAETILTAARKRHSRPDDMTVTVLKIELAP